MAGPSRRGRQGRGSAVWHTNTHRHPFTYRKRFIFIQYSAIHHFTRLHNTTTRKKKENPSELYSCPGGISLIQCQGNYVAQMIAQVRSRVVPTTVLSLTWPTSLHQRRVKNCSALSFESIDLLQFTGSVLYMRQQAVGRRALWLQSAPRHTDDDRGSIKCHLPSQPPDAPSIWMVIHLHEVTHALHADRTANDPLGLLFPFHDGWLVHHCLLCLQRKLI